MRAAWAGQLFVGNADMMYAGPVAPTRVHSHHAFQLVIVERGELTLRSAGNGEPVATSVALIPSDAEHAIVVGSMAAIMLYVDPDGIDGRRLRALAVPSDDASAWREAARPMLALTERPRPTTWPDAELLQRAMFDALVGASVRPVVQHPALLRAVRTLPQRLGAPLRLGAVADELAISESRLAHLFAEQLGLPFRSYVRWLRLRRAAEAVEAGRSLTEAAHEAGFADSAHLSRAFTRAFGIAPSDVTAFVEFVVGPPLTAA